MLKLQEALDFSREIVDDLFSHQDRINHLYDQHFNKSREQLISRFDDGRMSSTVFEAEDIFDIRWMLEQALCDFADDICKWIRLNGRGVTFTFNYEFDDQVGHGYKKWNGRTIAIKCYRIRFALSKTKAGDVYIRSVYPIE